jgi:hypothetical protein
MTFLIYRYYVLALCKCLKSNYIEKRIIEPQLVKIIEF